MLARLRARGDARRRAGSAGRGPQGDVAPAGLLRLAAVAASRAPARAARAQAPDGPAPAACGACVPRQ